MIKKSFLLIIALLMFAHQKSSWALDCYPLQISFTQSAQIASSEKSVCGLRLNLPIGSNNNVTGIDIGLIGAAVKSRGIQLNIINVSDENTGLQIAGLFNLTETVRGIQVAPLANYNLGIHTSPDMVGLQLAMFLNNHDGDITGAQIGLFNWATNLHGVQAGLINNVEYSVTGFQVGLVNVAHELKGVQIGLLNIAHNGIQPYFPLINIGF